MGVYISDARTVQTFVFDQCSSFMMISDYACRQEVEKPQGRFSRPNVAHCEFADDEGMDQNIPVTQQLI